MRGASIILAVALLVTASIAAWSQTMLYTPAELDELLGPIALYPDPLIAQILPAATYPDQLQEAYQMQLPIGSIASQPWDLSVKAVAHYPSVLGMMATNLDWTIAIGQAYVNQPDDVMRSIQRLRLKARSLGYLSSNSYQTVSVSNGYIYITPAQPQYVYVPTYNPSVVYVERRPAYGNWISFGAGLLIGAWLNNAIDWHHHRVYNHGWRGGGWIGRARPHVRYNDRAYVNPAWRNRAAPINRGISSRDITNYRRDIQRNRGRYAPPGLVAPGVRPTPTTRPARPGVRPGARPTAPATVPGVRPTTPTVPGGAGPTARPARRARPSTVTRPTTPAAPTVRTTPERRVPSTTAPAVRRTRPVRPAPGVSRPGATAPVRRYAPGPMRPTYRPGAGPRRAVPAAPAVRPAPRPNVGVVRPVAPVGRGTVRSAPATRPAPPRAQPSPRAGERGTRERG